MKELYSPIFLAANRAIFGEDLYDSIKQRTNYGYGYVYWGRKCLELWGHFIIYSSYSIFCSSVLLIFLLFFFSSLCLLLSFYPYSSVSLLCSSLRYLSYSIVINSFFPFVSATTKPHLPFPITSHTPLFLPLPMLLPLHLSELH